MRSRGRRWAGVACWVGACYFVLAAHTELSSCHRVRDFLLPQMGCVLAAWILQWPARRVQRVIILGAGAVLLAVGLWAFYDFRCVDSLSYLR